MIDEQRRLAFSDGWQAGMAVSHMPPVLAERTRKEKELVNCADCTDHDCKYRNKPARLPVDAGGENQCLRLALSMSPYSFRNGEGTVIIIPDEVIRAIRGEDASGNPIHDMILSELQDAEMLYEHMEEETKPLYDSLDDLE